MTQARDLITPTGLLIMAAEVMHDDHGAWLAARRWRQPDHLTAQMIVQMDTKRQHAEGYRIGASDVPSILDLEGVDTQAHVFRNKVYNIADEPNEAMGWGHRLEDAIATEWCRRNRAVIDEIGLVAHRDQPWIQATVDRRVRECPVSKNTPHGECFLEVKNMGPFAASRWHKDLPDRIMAQMVVQRFVTGYDHGHYACLVGGNQLKQGIVWADKDGVPELERYIVAEVNRFRDEHLLTGVEPAWNTSDKAARMIKLDKATHPERSGVHELTFDDIDAVHDYAKAAAEEGAAKKRKERAKARLLQLADGAAVVTWSGELAYEYGESTRTNVNLDKLKERHPGAYRDPEVVTETVSHPIKIAKTYKVANPREAS